MKIANCGKGTDSPYWVFGSAIETWMTEHYMARAFIVTLNVGGRIVTDIYEHDPSYGWCWMSDWYEGEDEAEMLGFVPLDWINVTGNNYAEVVIP